MRWIQLLNLIVGAGMIGGAFVDKFGVHNSASLAVGIICFGTFLMLLFEGLKK